MKHGAILVGSLLLTGCSLAGDITPPPALATVQMAQPVATVQAAHRPDITRGAALYSEHCAPCHGINGLGDGEMVAQLSFRPSPLGEAEFARAAAPEDWYLAVTRGNLDRLMPPFTRLSDQQRWDVVGFALSLSGKPEQLAQAQVLFEEYCQECHSQEGFSQTQFLENSVAEVFVLLQDGLGEDMPEFANVLNEDELWSLATYVQSLGWSGESPQPDQSDPAAEDMAELEDTTRVWGRIINGTAGATIPDGLEVTLIGVDGEVQALQEIAKVAPDGGFAFDDVEAIPGRLFFTTVDHGGVLYRSEFAHAAADGSALELPLTIYETTSDASGFSVERLHLLFDFPEEGVLRVLQLWVLANRSDKVLAGGDGLHVSLPLGSVALTFQDGVDDDRFEFTSDGFIDREPVPPGSGIDQLAFGFDLPLGGSARYEQPVQHPIEAVTVLLPADGPRISGLQDQGVRDLGGVQMHSYAAGPLAVGEVLSFQISDRSETSSVMLGAIIGAATLLGALLMAARIWGRKERQDVDSLVLAIAFLDDEYEAGKIAQHEYERQRAALERQALGVSDD